MWRKNDAHTPDDVEGVAQRLRTERPQASPLELDRIKTSAMSSVKRSARGRLGSRRLAVAGLTAGLLVATTGGVLAGQGGPSSVGNAAVAQYGNNCDVGNGNGNGSNNGNGNGSNNGNHNGSGSGNSGNNNNNCNENSFNETTINETVNNITNNTTNGGTTNITYTTVSAIPAVTPLSGVLGSKSAKTSSLRIKFHVKVPRGAKLAKVTVKVNGKRVKTLKGKDASANIELVNLPCSTAGTKVEISVTLSNGKTVTARHTYHLCTS